MVGKRGKKPRGGFPEMPRNQTSSESIPTVAAPEMAVNPKESEIDLIESAFPGQVTRETKKDAWKHITIILKVALTSRDCDSITFGVVATAELPESYPSLKPTIKLQFHHNDGLGSSYQSIMNNIAGKLEADKRDDGFVVLSVLFRLQEQLDKAAQVKAEVAKKPSLGEDKVIEDQRKEALRARQLAEEEAQRRQKEDAEAEAIEQEVHASGVHEAIDGRPHRTHRQSFKSAERVQSKTDEALTFKFQPPLKIKDLNGTEHVIDHFPEYAQIRQGPAATIYTAKPAGLGSTAQLVIIKHIVVTGNEHTVEFKDHLKTLEDEIKNHIHELNGHDNVLKVFGYRPDKRKDVNMDTDSVTWTVDIAMEYGNKGSLFELLISAGQLVSSRTREWSRSLLDGLAWIHGKGIIHGDIQASNILLVWSGEDVVTPKIADCCFQRSVQVMTGTPSFYRDATKFKSNWISPELREKDQEHCTDKTDIWFFGVVLLQMRWGLNLTKTYSGPKSLLDRNDISADLGGLIDRVFKRDMGKRPTAHELRTFEYLMNNEAENLHGDISNLSLQDRSKTRRMSTTQVDHLPKYEQRFAKDWDFVETLGEGAFGKVVLARSHQDMRKYAVKIINESEQSPFDEMNREVMMLAGLRHHYVVQYYQSWMEDGPQETPKMAQDEWSNRHNDPTVTGKSLRGPRNRGSGPVGLGSSVPLEYIVTSSRQARSSRFQGSDESESELSDDDRLHPLYRGREIEEASCGFEFGYSEGDEGTNSQGDENRGWDNEDGEVTRESHSGDSESEDKDSDSMAIDQSRRQSIHQGMRRLYIVMEHCPGATLRDPIKKGVLHHQPMEISRLLRQMLKGLEHIHGLNMIHRDLKPDNVFFASTQPGSDIRIGDLGLATFGRVSIKRGFEPDGHDMTSHVGTANYMAPEISAGARYDGKADMYSLGIILFEMCYKSMNSAHERGTVLSNIRRNPPVFPPDFPKQKAGKFYDIILQLLKHDPNERPTAKQLLESGDLPDSAGDDVIRQVRKSFMDPKSIYHKEMVRAILDRELNKATTRIWDAKNFVSLLNPERSVIRSVLEDELVKIFRKHGALEAPRAMMFPIDSPYPRREDMAKVVDHDGMPLQLRYDLTVPLARSVARGGVQIPKSYAFGNVYRQTFDINEDVNELHLGEEAVFDIVSENTDLMLHEAEVIKVLDDIMTTIPCLARENMCFNINHSDLLDAVFEHCAVAKEHRRNASDTLAKLDVDTYSWDNATAALLGFGLTQVSIRNLEEFSFRDPEEVASVKLQSLFAENFGQLASPLAHIRRVMALLSHIGVSTDILIAPLGGARERLCEGGLTFSAQFSDSKRLLGAGGRYDSLIQSLTPKKKGKSPKLSTPHGVGFNLNLGLLVDEMCLLYDKATAVVKKSNSKKYHRKMEDDVAAPLDGIWMQKRCEVLLCCHDATLRETEGLWLLGQLWDNGISAELAGGVGMPSDFHTKYKDSHYYLLVLKRDSSVKIKIIGGATASNGGDRDCHAENAAMTVKALIREREGRH